MNSNDKIVLSSSEHHHLGHLDGIRGLMAMWVYLGHLYFACSLKNLPIGPHGLAVDVFMVLSGFLMAYHWESRLGLNVTFKNASRFYLKRFFRIAPLFYVVVTVAHFVHRIITEIRIEGLRRLHGENAFGLIERLNPQNLGMDDLAMRLSFLFGLFPTYVSTNNIPDWSISLEMQFYVFFPLIILLVGRIGSLSSGIAMVGCGLIANKIIGVYAGSSGVIVFPQPSFLPLKISLFALGIFIAIAFNRFRKEKPFVGYLLLALCCAIEGLSWQVVLSIVVISAPLFLCWVKNDLGIKILESRPMRYLGDLSYGVYLIHNLILYPIIFLLSNKTWFVDFSGAMRFIVAFLVTSPIVFLVSAATYKWIEKPGIRIGQKCVQRFF